MGLNSFDAEAWYLVRTKRVRWRRIGCPGVLAAALALLASCDATIISTTFGPISASHFEYSKEGRVAIASYSVCAITKEAVESGAVTWTSGRTGALGIRCRRSFTCRIR